MEPTCERRAALLRWMNVVHQCMSCRVSVHDGEHAVCRVPVPYPRSTDTEAGSQLPTDSRGWMTSKPWPIGGFATWGESNPLWYR